MGAEVTRVGRGRNLAPKLKQASRVASRDAWWTLGFFEERPSVRKEATRVRRFLGPSL